MAANAGRKRTAVQNMGHCAKNGMALVEGAVALRWAIPFSPLVKNGIRQTLPLTVIDAALKAEPALDPTYYACNLAHDATA